MTMEDLRLTSRLLQSRGIVNVANSANKTDSL